MKRSPLRKKSKTTEAQLKRKVFELAKRVARERDKTCRAEGVDGRTCWGYLQASHIYNEGTYRSMRYDLDNMIGMCTWHHIYWWHKNPIDAGIWIKNYLGEAKYKALRERSWTNRVIPTSELEQRYKELLDMV